MTNANFVPLSATSQSLRDATISMEDAHFYQHFGFDWVAIHRALRVDVRQGKIEQGGSTITQQLAKNLFLNDDRTIWRKINEAAYTLALERELSKQRILELYLNTVNYGCNQHGIRDAAQFYFHKPASELNMTESAILVGMVPHPLTLGNPPNRAMLLQGEQAALSRMVYYFPQQYSESDMDRALALPVNNLVYPYKDAWDRGATYEIPATMNGVNFYYYTAPNCATPIEQAAKCLEQRLDTFTLAAHTQFHITGIDHLGVYNDRNMRQSNSHLSAHAYGQAIDISGFRFQDGHRIDVKNHTDPVVNSELASIEALLKKHFDIVVDWRDEPLRHQTHFHCEVKGARSKVPRSPYNPAKIKSSTTLDYKTSRAMKGFHETLEGSIKS